MSMRCCFYRQCQIRKEGIMASVTVRNLPDKVHRAGLNDEDIAVIEQMYDKALAEPVRFE